jgi:ribosomal protein S6--L-glutamate ligase
VVGGRTAVEAGDEDVRLCFIVEDRYKEDPMPLDVARRLADWGHEVDVLEPQRSLTPVSELVSRGLAYDAYVLKTVSNGPGLSILEAAAAAGHVTINPAPSIRLVRDKVIAAAILRRHGIPHPLTYFATHVDLVACVPRELYPIVVKPSNGSGNADVHRVESADELARLDTRHLPPTTFFIAQPYAENPGRDLKLYATGDDIFATVQPSPLHPAVSEVPRLVTLPSELRGLVAQIGRIFGLEVFGVDIVESPEGWVVVDVNDFPSFHMVPDASGALAETVLRLAAAGERAPVLSAEPAGALRGAAAIGARLS